MGEVIINSAPVTESGVIIESVPAAPVEHDAEHKDDDDIEEMPKIEDDSSDETSNAEATGDDLNNDANADDLGDDAATDDDLGMEDDLGDAAEGADATSDSDDAATNDLEGIKATDDAETGFGDLDAADDASDDADITDLGDDAIDDLDLDVGDDAADADPAKDVPDADPPAVDNNPIDDIFDGADADAGDAADAPIVADNADGDDVEDLFGGDDIVEDAGDGTEVADDVEDLFGGDDDAADADADAGADLEDLFDEGAFKSNEKQDPVAFREITPVTKPVAKKAETKTYRLWVDNTGNYKTVGQLVKITSSHIRLLKENGRYSTVPLRRLSNEDRLFVDTMKSKLGVEGFEIVAQR